MLVAQKNKKKVAVVAGTRPEAIKMASVYMELRRSEVLEPLFISTAQHRQMLDQTLEIFGIKPDYDMDVMRPEQTLCELTERLLAAWRIFFANNKLDAILVQGDTKTVLASAIAAFYERIPIGHVEAGLRTGNLMSPWPEEMNRRLADPISRWCFAPTELSLKNLLAEGIAADRCFVTGNTVVDSLIWMREQLAQQNVAPAAMAAKCGVPALFASQFLEKKGSPWILMTGHRRESFGEGFQNICRAVADLVEQYPDVGVLYPVHLNPNVQEPVKRLLGSHDRIALIPPVSYREFIWLMDRCRFVLSDSGGVQEEAPGLGKPVLVMRDTTERPEGVAAGTCRLVGTDPSTIVREAGILLNDSEQYAKRSALRNPYGDGTASRRIREIIEADLCS